jgi:hypothetical protein
MTGYAVTARIEPVQPRRTRLSPRARWTPAVAVRATDDRVGPTAEDLGPAPSERWVRVRDRWSQLCFYLWDPEGWR